MSQLVLEPVSTAIQWLFTDLWGLNSGVTGWVHLRRVFAFSSILLSASSPYWHSCWRCQDLSISLGLESSPESKVWFWTTLSGTGGLKSQAYFESRSLDWMVRKNLWSNMPGPEAHNSGCLLEGPYMFLTPRNDSSSAGGRVGLKSLVLPLPGAVSALKCGGSRTQPQLTNTELLLFTFKKRNHIWLFSILLLHFYCHLQNSSEGQRKPFCLTYLIF